MLCAVPFVNKQASTYPKSSTRQQGKEFLRHVSYILKKKKKETISIIYQKKRHLNTGAVFPYSLQ